MLLAALFLKSEDNEQIFTLQGKIIPIKWESIARSIDIFNIPNTIEYYHEGWAF